MPVVDLARLPRHVAIIMDGNGRWARRQGQLRTLGHSEGSKAVRRIVRLARRLGLDALTLYAFSEQNWSRPEPEVEALMELLRQYLVEERDELLDRGIRLRAIGRKDRLPPRVRDVLLPLETETAGLTGMTLSLALSYGGREELVDAARAAAKAAANGTLDPDRLDEAAFAALQPSMDVGPVDLLVRTGGEQRISNFLLWGAAYAELHFSAKLWPDYDESDLMLAIADYQSRERRFGGVLDAPLPPVAGEAK
ncbi:MAG: polyprenyl diphosphate synthase [Candidatus Eisenbacteria bacterium]|nr:polyprenyl diphosphate synthase [Candidatus Eisenbacteria bacterium]